MKHVETAVLATVHDMTNSFHGSDLEAVMSTYERSATVAFEPGVPVTDRSVTRERFTEAFGLSPRFEYSGHEVMVEGDLALHIAPWRMTAAAPDGQEIEQSGLSVSVLRRQKDGRWLIVIDNPHGQHLLQSA